MRDAVLVIDDDPDCREVIGVVMETLGLRLLEAPDCPRALEVIAREQGRILLVLLDYRLPGSSPADCAAALRAVCGEAPIVLWSAAVDADARARELGLREWLAKPFDLEDLEQLVRRERAAG